MSRIPTQAAVELVEHCLELLETAASQVEILQARVDDLAPKARAWEEVYLLAQRDRTADLDQLESIWGASQMEGDQGEPEP